MIVKYSHTWFFALGLTLMNSAYGTDITLKVTGVSEPLEKNILSTLSIAQKKARDLPLDDLKDLSQKAPIEIQKALQPFGYYHAEVTSHWVETGDKLLVQYNITLNEPTRVDEVHLKLEGDGMHNPALSNVFQPFPLRAGDVLNHSVYEQGKNSALEHAMNEGYVKAYFSEHQILVDLSRFKADIDLTLDTGPQFHMGEVTFEKNYYANEFLKRFVNFNEKDIYRIDHIADLESHLMQSNLFSSVHVTPTLDEDTHQMNLDVKVKEAKANRYLAGVGYDTNVGARARLGWDRKKFNDFGHQFKSHAKISQVETIVDAQYIIPGRKPWIDRYQISGAYAHESYDERPSTLYTFEFSDTTQWGSWTRTLALRYLREDFSDTNYYEQSSKLLLPSFVLSKTKFDRLGDPRNGYRIRLSARGGLSAIVSDDDFLQVQGHFKYLKAVSQPGTIITRVDLGATFPDNTEDLPLSIRFYAGGIDSLRGFKFRYLPVDVTNSGAPLPVGGTYLVLGSLEYDHTVYGPFKLAAFVDGGSALRGLNDDLQMGVGLGIRWQTPVGPLKLDLAQPVTNAAKVLRLHFSFGAEL